MSDPSETIRKMAVNVLREVDFFHTHLRQRQVSTWNLQWHFEQLGFQREGPVGYLVVSSGGREIPYVLCRSGNPGQGANADYLSYKAPLGKLASLKVGESAMIGLRRHPHSLPTPTEFVLVAKGLFRTRVQDAVENFLSPPLPEVYIPSLRDLLSGKFSFADKRPRKRPAIQAISLRDQVVVDGQQDPLFRLPIDTTLAISGSPGTGKTTVMIKRLATKTSRGALVQAGELNEADQVDHLFEPERSWMLFTPTELLKNYVKESLGREGMAATDQTVRIWNDYREEIARDCFRLLKVGKHSGAFRCIAEHEQASVSDDSIRLLLSRFEDALQNSDIEQRAEGRIRKRKRAALVRKGDSESSISTALAAASAPSVGQRLSEYVRLVPKYYKLFRRRNPLLAKFYGGKPKPDSITDHELDVLILIILKRFRKDLTPQLLRGETTLGSPDLDRISELLRTVVAVDEATDFSSVQLACMQALTHPRFNSFTLCGDLMQRLTGYGLAQWESLNAVMPAVRVEMLSRSYRQSPRLLAVATDLYKMSVGHPAPFSSAYDESDYEQIPPLLLEEAADPGKLVSWLCGRIIETF